MRNRNPRKNDTGCIQERWKGIECKVAHHHTREKGLAASEHELPCVNRQYAQEKTKNQRNIED
jgi:hypothetical protein